MRNPARKALCACLLVAAMSGCHRGSLTPGSTGSAGGGGRGTAGAGGGAAGGAIGGGATGGGATGRGATGGAIGGTGGVVACTGASDARLVLAGQRILRLTANELLNTVRYLVGDAEAAALVSDGVVDGSGDNVAVNRKFPPLQASTIDGTIFAGLDGVATHVASYVLASFATVTGCATATDACATAYLDKLAAKAYRRPLTPDEEARFQALYTRLRGTQTVNGYSVTFTVEEATSYAVDALLSSPQMLWRWEIGDPAMASTSPAGIPLTDLELATQLSFFLTDQPPDDSLLAAASAGALRANLSAHVDGLLASQTARDWLRTIMETYLSINKLPAVSVDPLKFPLFSPVLVSEMGTEARAFLDEALWNGDLTDLLLSRTAFLNTDLADNIYMVPAPAGATGASFVRTTLPADQRAGLLTNAAFLTVRARADGHALVVPRGLAVAAVLLCLPASGPDMRGPVDPTAKPLSVQTSQEQVAARAAQPACKDCHAQFDPYGLALDNYDNLGRYRTIDDLNQPVDAHTQLPAAIGGDVVTGGVELAEALATKPAFTACMARALLQYAMVDPATTVEAPLPGAQAGCATIDVVQRYRSANGKTFTDLVRATAATPAFVLREAAP